MVSISVPGRIMYDLVLPGLLGVSPALPVMIMLTPALPAWFAICGLLIRELYFAGCRSGVDCVSTRSVMRLMTTAGRMHSAQGNTNTWARIATYVMICGLELRIFLGIQKMPFVPGPF